MLKCFIYFCGITYAYPIGTSNNFYAFSGILIKIKFPHIFSNIIIKYVKFIFKINYDFSRYYTLERIIHIDLSIMRVY